MAERERPGENRGTKWASKHSVAAPAPSPFDEPLVPRAAQIDLAEDDFV
ncbi:MAG: hypothetical protein V7606_2319 [Burkholderiales bacterium]